MSTATATKNAPKTEKQDPATAKLTAKKVAPKKAPKSEAKKGAKILKAATTAAINALDSLKPSVTGFIAETAKANRSKDGAAKVREGSQTAIALSVIVASKTPITTAQIVEGMAALKAEPKWPVGMLRGMEAAGLIQKFAAENKRTAFAITERGKATIKSLK